MSQEVYVVVSGVYSSRAISAVFSSQEKAEAYIRECRKAEGGYSEVYDILACTVDAQVGKVMRVPFVCNINVDDGAISYGPTEYHEPVMALPTEIGEWRLSTISNVIQVRSFVSCEHAAHLAAEARHAYLRDKNICGGKMLWQPAERAIRG